MKYNVYFLVQKQNQYILDEVYLQHLYHKVEKDRIILFLSYFGYKWSKNKIKIGWKFWVILIGLAVMISLPQILPVAEVGMNSVRFDENYIKVNNFEQHLYAGNWLERNTENVVVGAEISRKLSMGLFDFNNALEVYAPKPGKGNIDNPNEAFNKALLFPTGIYSINEEIDGKFVFCTIDVAQNLLSLPHNSYTNIEIKTTKKSNEKELRAELNAVFGENIKVFGKLLLIRSKSIYS